MAVQVTVSAHNGNPNTIWNRLAEKLGRLRLDDEEAILLVCVHCP